MRRRSAAAAAALWGLLLWLSPASAAQQGIDHNLAEFAVTLPSGSAGRLVRPVRDGSYPAVLHLHGSGDTVAGNIDVLRMFARAGYVAMDIEYRRSRLGAVDMNDLYASFDFLNRAPTIRLNGQEVDRFSTSNMIHDVETYIAEISKYCTLYPGDVIWMGTDGSPRNMKPGDVCEIEISDIGVLRNRVIAEE